MKTRVLATALFASMLLAASGAQARDGSMTCKMQYTLTGWSVIYKHAEGKGTVRCSNGQSMAVKLSAKGGGLTLGKK